MLILFLFVISFNLRGQDTIRIKNGAWVIMDTTSVRTITQFEEDLALVGMKFTLPTQYNILYKFDNIPPCGEQDCPLKRLGMVHSILRHKDEECKIVTYVSAGWNRELIENRLIKRCSRIKYDLELERKGLSDVQQKVVLDSLITFYSQDSAKAFFNGDLMLSYPFDLKNKLCENKYTNVKVIVAEKNGLQLFLYFVMTDNGAKNFDKYLNDLKGTFWYN